MPHSDGAIYLAKHGPAGHRFILTDIELARLEAGEDIQTIAAEHDHYAIRQRELHGITYMEPRA